MHTAFSQRIFSPWWIFCGRFCSKRKTKRTKWSLQSLHEQLLGSPSSVSMVYTALIGHVEGGSWARSRPQPTNKEQLYHRWALLRYSCWALLLENNHPENTCLSFSWKATLLKGKKEKNVPRSKSLHFSQGDWMFMKGCVCIYIFPTSLKSQIFFSFHFCYSCSGYFRKIKIAVFLYIK